MEDMAKNQCDGCARGLAVDHGYHVNSNGNPIQLCEAGRYQDVKTHMVSMYTHGKHHTVFVTLPAGEKPTINGEDLHKLCGIRPGSCVKIG